VRARDDIERPNIPSPEANPGYKKDDHALAAWVSMP
jgi:hypothetical protein